MVHLQRLKEYTMYKALKNFTSVGKTYLVGDNVPASLASSLDPSLVEASEVVSKPKKSHIKSEVKASHKGEY